MSRSSISTSSPSSKAKAVDASPVLEWCVVGAGPAGIACVGQLLSRGVSPTSILWVDPSFEVGDFGTLWRHVSSNTTVGLFRRFYRHCPAFGWQDPPQRTTPYAIDSMTDKDTCELQAAAQPLRDITDRLAALGVHTLRGRVTGLRQGGGGHWGVTVDSLSLHASSSPPSSTTFLATSCILCTGSEPNDLPLHRPYSGVSVVPLSVALNPQLLVAAIKPSDVVTVVGSSHTAVILLRTLLEQTQCKAVINLYKAPLRYAVYLDGWILFDDTGLKGSTAAWSRAVLHSELPPRLTRIYSDEAGVKAALSQSTKVIYATGFHQRPLPEGIEGLTPGHGGMQPVAFNPHCGIIAPGLFGAGIGYPEERTDRYGNVESRVGLWKFMEYIDSAMPLWQQYNVQQLIGQPKGSPPKAAPTPATLQPHAAGNHASVGKRAKL